MKKDQIMENSNIAKLDNGSILTQDQTIETFFKQSISDFEEFGRSGLRFYKSFNVACNLLMEKLNIKSFNKMFFLKSVKIVMKKIVRKILEKKVPKSIF
jgi:hypothetical protein